MFGKVINLFDSIATTRDYYMGKVGILTTRRTWINEEITIKVSDVEYRVGVVEYMDDLSPFNPTSFDKVEESEEEEDHEEGIFEAWMEEEDEEGEFRSDQS